MPVRAYAPVEPAWVTTALAGGAVESLPAGTYIYEWAGLQTGDTGAWLPVGMFPGKSVSIDAGTNTVAFEGTDEPVPNLPQALHDPQGLALSFTAAGKKEVLEDTLWIRPNCSAGAGTVKARIILTTPARR